MVPVSCAAVPPAPVPGDSGALSVVLESESRLFMCGRSGSSEGAGELEAEPFFAVVVELLSLGLREGTKWGRESSSLPMTATGVAECWVSLCGGGAAESGMKRP